MTISIVLENTSHPGNIGAAARAMYTMGFEQLILINPCPITEDSYTRARLGKNIIDNAVIATDLDCLLPFQKIYGTSCRHRSLHLPLVSSKGLSGSIDQHEKCQTAVLFGNETNGLSNEMLAICQAIIEIPTHKQSSLNLSHAVQLICYELSSIRTLAADSKVASLAARLNLLSQVAKKHQDSGLILPHTLDRLKVIINKAELSEEELKLLFAFFL